MISAEQFAEWKEHPVTKEIYVGLKKVRESLAEDLAIGNTLCESAEDTHGSTNRIVGQIAGLDQILDLHYAAEESKEVDGQSNY